jgi:SAM-dependent methyltransferase
MALANRRPNRIAIDALKIASSDTVLELGFGPGRAIRTLNAMVPRGLVLGIDHSVAMLAQASRYNRHAIRIGRVKLQQGHFDALPWGPDSVDKILAVNVVYFFRADAAEIREARRVLRPGGMMAIYATDKSAMGRWKFSNPETHHIFDRDDLRALILNGGAANDEVSVCSVVLPFQVTGVLAIFRKGTDGAHRSTPSVPQRSAAVGIGGKAELVGARSNRCA